MEFTVLNNGVKMPMEGFGVFQVADQVVCEQAVLDAVSVGYRLIDTAASYMNEEALALMGEYGVRPEAWGPFAEGRRDIFNHPVLTAIGEKYHKSAAQVALRWNVQQGVAVIPKSVHKNRMEQNMDIWDFVLSEEDMKEIAKLDIGHSEIVNHFDPAFVRMLHGRKIHS